MSFSILTVAVGLCLTIIYLVKQVYVFQIKEYRFDRIKARIEDVGIFDFLYGLDVRIPSTKHPRNIVLLFFGCVVVTLVSLIPQSIVTGVLLILFSPVIAFGATAMGVVLTSLPVKLYRVRIVRKASSVLEYAHPTIIGITGSYGKSTVKDYLHHILSFSYKTAKTDKNQNTAVGVALSILKNLTKETQYFVAEMGAYKQGEIQEITQFAQPKIAVITAIGSQHLSLFGGKEKLFKAKSEIAQNLPKDGRLFLASDIDKIMKFRLQRITPCPIEEYAVVPHEPHQTAIHAAIAVARHCGLPDETIEKAVLLLDKPSHLRVQHHAKGHAFIDCSYNSNVEGFIAHLHMLRSVKKPKKIVLTSGIIELGGHKELSYRQILENLPPHSTLYTSDKAFKKVARTSQSRSIVYSPSHIRLSSSIQKILDADTVILVEGRFRADLISGIVS